jgi:hypothetical protein
MSNPAEIHYKVLKDLIAYLAATPHYGIHYWHQRPREDLPESPPPMLHPDNNSHITLTTSEAIYGYVDSDWGTNTP